MYSWMETSLSVVTVRVVTTKCPLTRAGVKNNTCPRDGELIMSPVVGRTGHIFLRDGRAVITLRDGNP